MSDPGDAKVLADVVRTDRYNCQPVTGDSELAKRSRSWTGQSIDDERALRSPMTPGSAGGCVVAGGLYLTARHDRDGRRRDGARSPGAERSTWAVVATQQCHREPLRRCPAEVCRGLLNAEPRTKSVARRRSDAQWVLTLVESVTQPLVLGTC
jgi:hypothetical protein